MKGIPLVVMAAAKSPQGCRAGDLRVNPDSVRQTISSMCKRGLLFKATLSHAHVVYFDTAKQAAAFVRNTTAEKRAKFVVHGRPTRAKWSPDAPAVITPKTIYTIAPPLPARVLRTNTHSPL